jgi:hypothetical protein
MSNPRGLAFAGNFSSFGSVWFGNPQPPGWGIFEADGRVDFAGARVATAIIVTDARFLGARGDAHGFFGSGTTSGDFLFWRNVQLQNGASVDLSGAHVGILLDEEKSWPEQGNLLIDGFTYDGFGAGSPLDVQSRLRWISLQPPVQGGFRPQPYRQLAKVLRESGDDTGAIEVLIAQQDAHFRNSNWLVRAWAQFLKITVAYGYRPLRTVLWSLAVILLGRIVVAVGARAGVMRLTWPETTPPPAGDPTAGLHPLLYSLDVFLPLVNLHQEHYWWPDESASGEYRLLGRDITIRGSILRYYLWLQIIAGWLLSAIFIAGVTGLMHND